MTAKLFVANGLATSSFSYDPATLALDTETITYTIPGQAAFTRVLDRSRDTLGRDTGYTLGTPSPSLAVETQATYGYSPTHGRLQTVAGASSGSFTYSYLPSSNLLSTISSSVHTVTNTYEANRDILASKQNKAGAIIVSNYDYTVNEIGQRSGLSQSGSAFASTRSTAWAYDSLGQVTRADSSIPGLDRAYQFDMIGNRLKTADSLTLPSTNNYTANALNQYTAVQQGSVGVSPAYDDDGNMTAGPLPANINANSTLVWDAENRLIEATVGTSGSLVRYSYDSQSRRIAETTEASTTLFIYDGWNCIAEYGSVGVPPASISLSKTRLWGTDLSGSLQGAGGVGGLLAETHHSGTAATYFPTYDGNGNVSEYLNSSGTVVAHYEYDPFGRTTVATGAKAQDFSHRFSTKPLDATTGLYYYGYRHYDPVTGRWPSRDPIEEQGGVNLYGFVGNDGINELDYLGLFGGGGIGGPQIPGWTVPAPPSPPPSGGGWGGALNDLINWLTGNAPTTTGYGPGTPESDDMKNSPIGNKLREGYLNKFKDKKCAEWGDYTNVKLSFGASEFIQSIPNGTAHFVGSGRGDAYTKEIDEKKCKIKSEFTITNTTSLKSAFYHLIPNSWNNTSTGTPGANWTQTYTWNEEFDCEK